MHRTQSASLPATRLLPSHSSLPLSVTTKLRSCTRPLLDVYTLRSYTIVGGAGITALHAFILQAPI